MSQEPFRASGSLAQPDSVVDAVLMRKDELERRAAEMRARQKSPEQASPKTKAKEIPKPTPPPPPDPTATLDLPAARPHDQMDRVWKRQQVDAMLAALSISNELVVKTAIAIRRKQVRHDGIIMLGGKDELAIEVSVRALPRALRFFQLLIVEWEALGGQIEIGEFTFAAIRGEKIPIRLREGTRSEPDPRYRSMDRNVPTGELFLVVKGKGAAQFRTSVRGEAEIRAFLGKVDRYAGRLPGIRQAAEEQQEQWRRERAEEERRNASARQRREQIEQEQNLYKAVMLEIERWETACKVRRYLAAVEEKHTAIGKTIPSGSEIEGWLRWLYRYADSLDPLTRITEENWNNTRFNAKAVTHEGRIALLRAVCRTTGLGFSDGMKLIESAPGVTLDFCFVARC